jgi:hypothetical protein
MKHELSHKRNVTAKQSIKILRKNGLEVTEEEAAKILDLMYFLSGLVVSQMLKDNELVDVVQQKEGSTSTK